MLWRGYLPLTLVDHFTFFSLFQNVDTMHHLIFSPIYLLEFCLYCVNQSNISTPFSILTCLHFSFFVYKFLHNYVIKYVKRSVLFFDMIIPYFSRYALTYSVNTVNLNVWICFSSILIQTCGYVKIQGHLRLPVWCRIECGDERS